MEHAGTTLDEPLRLDTMKQSPNRNLTCSLGDLLKFCFTSMQRLKFRIKESSSH